MLSLALEPNEYITINGNVVVQISKLSKSRCYLAIKADRSVPIVRGEVLERGGNPPPACLDGWTPPRKPKRKNGVCVRWDGEREQALLTLEKIADRLERKGDGNEAEILRAQLRQLAPDGQEKESI